jgi:bifunctional UDP-N-acetylglucosamine pyrophosphorylase/glucosamine-1-phosphate N-acetyltransferase
MDMDLHIVILAAGKGTRMKSELPKVMHKLAGKPLLQHVIDSALLLKPAGIHVVYGHQGEVLKKLIVADKVNWVHQEVQQGTGHAVHQVLPHLPDNANVLILYGDVPLIRAESLSAFLQQSEHCLGLMTITQDDGAGYGRILRTENGTIVGIVEQKDATAGQRKIREINTGIMAAPVEVLKKWLPALTNHNAQGEFYLTDIVAMAAQSQFPIRSSNPAFQWEVDGVNDRVQLARLERIVQLVKAEQLMLSGVTLMDPARLDIRGTLVTGADCTIDVNVVFEGDCSLGSHVTIGPNCVIKNATIASNVTIEANSIVEDSVLDSGCSIGPFARIRPGSHLGVGSRVGNFVEIKKSALGEGSKVNHLSYVGDASIGTHVNVGAGTITCNYDGVNKHQTVIGNDVFVGSNTALVAPVTVGDGVTIGAGSTITKDIDGGSLAVARAPQRTISSWKRPSKKK